MIPLPHNPPMCPVPIHDPYASLELMAIYLIGFSLLYLLVLLVDWEEKKRAKRKKKRGTKSRR